MKPQHFVALLVAAVLSLAVAVTAYVSTQPWTAAGNGNAEAMLPALKTSGDKVAAIEIDQGGKIAQGRREGRQVGRREPGRLSGQRRGRARAAARRVGSLARRTQDGKEGHAEASGSRRSEAKTAPRRG